MNPSHYASFDLQGRLRVQIVTCEDVSVINLVDCLGHPVIASIRNECTNADRTTVQNSTQNEYLVYSAMHMARLYAVTSLNDLISGNMAHR